MNEIINRLVITLVLMKINQIVYIFLILFTLTNCKNNAPKEEEILNDIFPQLVDSLDIVMTNYFLPPAPPLYDKDTNFIGIDTIAAELIKTKYKRALNKIDSVDSRLLFGINDSCFIINLKSINKRVYNENELLKRVLSANVNSVQRSRKLIINQIDCGNDYQIVYNSELKNKYDNAWSVKDRRFGGVISISKAYFDKANKVGLIQFEIFQSPMDGGGYYLILQEVNNKWLIKRIFKSWVI